MASTAMRDLPYNMSGRNLNSPVQTDEWTAATDQRARDHKADINGRSTAHHNAYKGYKRLNFFLQSIIVLMHMGILIISAYPLFFIYTATQTLDHFLILFHQNLLETIQSVITLVCLVINLGVLAVYNWINPVSKYTEHRTWVGVFKNLASRVSAELTKGKDDRQSAKVFFADFERDEGEYRTDCPEVPFWIRKKKGAEEEPKEEALARVGSMADMADATASKNPLDEVVVD